MTLRYPGSRFIYATIDQEQSVNSELLEELVSKRVIFKVDGHPYENYLKRDLKKRGITNTENIYLIPFSSHKTPLSKFHLRSIFHTDKEGNVYQFKGIGNISQHECDQGDYTTVNTKRNRLANVPLNLKSEQYGVFGGVDSREVEDTMATYNKLSTLWSKLQTASPRLSREFNITGAPPFVVPIAAFRPLELIARVPAGSPKSVRVPSNLVDPQKKLRVLLLHGRTTPNRIEYVNKAKLPFNEKEAHIRALIAHYGIKGAKGALTIRKLEKLHFKILERLRAVAFVATTAGKSLTVNADRNNVLGLKDFNGHMFYDIQNLGRFTSNSYWQDIEFILNQSDEIARFLEIPKERWQNLRINCESKFSKNTTFKKNRR